MDYALTLIIQMLSMFLANLKILSDKKKAFGKNYLEEDKIQSHKTSNHNEGRIATTSMVYVYLSNYLFIPPLHG